MVGDECDTVGGNIYLNKYKDLNSNKFHFHTQTFKPVISWAAPDALVANDKPGNDEGINYTQIIANFVWQKKRELFMKIKKLISIFQIMETSDVSYDDDELIAVILIIITKGDCTMTMGRMTQRPI